MSHPYGRKTHFAITKKGDEIKAKMTETSKKVMERTGTEIVIFEFKGQPHAMVELAIRFMLQQRYCEPWEIFKWAGLWTKEKGGNFRMITTFEPINNGSEANGLATTRLSTNTD
jgi:hypothetical protein